jgi:hypothetical protein
MYQEQIDRAKQKAESEETIKALGGFNVKQIGASA